jgi:hypothetical protein
MSADTMALLEAGAIMPAGTAVPKDDTIDTLTCRTYRHPVLTERTVVRLVPGTLGEAEDLSMEFLGFARPEQVAKVGVVRQQALGFPAWALVHDPANGHHALALVKEIERLARTAKSRIGPAKAGFDALGERLARSVPHFLPTFYEEAGRAFLVADSTTYAATMFGKAREAERAYALVIDEERQHAVFLEFALAGALTAKALSSHARDLAARCEPAEAYERFRRLAVERTLGGLPPYAAMHTDLRRLAKNAKLDQATADEQVLRELLAAPAIHRAPEAFWAAYRTPLARLAAAEASLRGRLLGMFPQHCGDEVWLGVLEEAGATAALTEPAGTVAAQAESPDGPAGWLGRMDVHREQRSWRDTKRQPTLLALVERMAGRLKADGKPVELCRAHDNVDLDLVDACLALGVPVADPSPDADYYVGRWLEDETEGRRDLVAMGGDERFVSALADSVEHHLSRWRDNGAGNAERVRAVVDVPGLRTAVRAWLETLADTVSLQGLPTLGKQFSRVESLACQEGFAINPAAVRRILDHDLGPVLGRTLRAGVLDEYGWPALEAAAARLAGGKKDEAIALTAQWPALVARRGDQVLVVGRDGVELEHLVRIPADERYYMWRLVLRYVDGQLLVCWDKGPDRAGYWTGAPDDVFTVPDDAFDMNDMMSLPLPGGGRTLGGRPLHVGDRSERRVGRVASDGTTYWVLSDVDRKYVWREFDPATGEVGRVSMPTFFEDGAVDGQSLTIGSCWLRPASAQRDAQPDHGPLGVGAGLIGWRVRQTPDGARAGESADGRSFALPAGVDLDGELVAAVRFPGSDATFGLLWTQRWRDSSITLCDSDGFTFGKYDLGGERPKFAKGTPLMVPPAYWHYLRPRDAAGSAALRAITDEQCGTLVTEAVGLKDDGVRALVGRAIPQLTDESLIAGVAGVVKRAAKHAAKLRELAGVFDGQPTAAQLESAKQSKKKSGKYGADTDTLLSAALYGIIRYCYSRGDSSLRLIEQAGAALTAAQPPAGEIDLDADLDWFDALGLLPAAMYKAAAPLTTPEQRQAVLQLLETCSRSGLLAPGSRLRRATLVADGKGKLSYKKGQALRIDGHRLLVLSVDTDDREVYVLQWSPDGKFGAVPGFKITDERIFKTAAADPATIDAFVPLARQMGSMNWRPEWAQALSEAAGMSYAEAVLLLAGLPSQPWEKAEAEPARVTLGLPDPAAANVAAGFWRAGWQEEDQLDHAGLLAELLPQELAALWTEGPRHGHLAQLWTQRHGKRSPVRDELIVAIDRAGVDGAMRASELIHGIANPQTCRWLVGSVDGLDDDDVLIALAKALPWLVYHLPADDPIRAALPVAAAMARQRLRDPAFAVEVGYLDGKKVDAFASALGVTAVTGPKGTEIGPVLLPDTDDWRQLNLRPALLRGVDDPVFAVLTARIDDLNDSVVAAVRAHLGDQITEVVGYSVTEVTEGFAQDPIRSAPALVPQVATELGLGADAAALYLQLLALPDPTDRNVAQWTGWKPARLKAARAELAATDLVVEAKRPRAGRSLFLPGGWLALKVPHLPLERWKLPLLIGGEGAISGLGIVIPVAPPPRLFDLAWARVRAGDPPRFDDLVTERRR